MANANVYHVTKFPLYLSFRDGPLENLWEGGGGRAKYKKTIRAREN